VVRLLLAAGADKNVDRDGKTVLAMAEERGCTEVAAELRRAGARGLREALANNPGSEVLLAVQTGDMVRLKRLVARRVSLDVRDAQGSTPIILATKRWDDAVFRFLVKHATGITPALLNAKGNDGMPALTWAARYGRTYYVCTLLATGADPNVKEPEGETALHFAANSGDVTSIKALLAAGANVKAVDNEGTTPLSRAIRNRHTPAIQALRAAGA
jgi:ankyrin repeat protein